GCSVAGMKNFYPKLFLKKFRCVCPAGNVIKLSVTSTVGRGLIKFVTLEVWEISPYVEMTKHLT
ncbi:MAG: hypothetical protein K2X48_16620, partial [Chitinophagaceae bacterium]|nr:hypothetical protein [Chitinophagaceae bacterium]